MSGTASWLEAGREEALDPDRKIIDPHHHFWDRPQSRYILDDLNDDTSEGHNIVATVFVECGSMYRADGPRQLRPVGETEYVNGIAAQSASGQYGDMRAALGIVGHADLRLGSAVDEVLEAHLAAAPERFRGIRHSTGWEEHDVVPRARNPEGTLTEMPEFREGLRRLADFDLSFDAWFYHPQIPDFTDLCRSAPDTTIVLDHFGGPLGVGPYEGTHADYYEKWKTDIAELAKCENVNAKLGGINMAINGFGWDHLDKQASSQEIADRTRDYYLHTIDCFGPARCMMESNFPVDKVSCGYGVLWNVLKRVAEGFSDAEKDDLFFGVANRVYRLGL